MTREEAIDELGIITSDAGFCQAREVVDRVFNAHEAEVHALRLALEEARSAVNELARIGSMFVTSAESRMNRLIREEVYAARHNWAEAGITIVAAHGPLPGDNLDDHRRYTVGGPSLDISWIDEVVMEIKAPERFDEGKKLTDFNLKREDFITGLNDKFNKRKYRK